MLHLLSAHISHKGKQDKHVVELMCLTLDTVSVEKLSMCFYLFGSLHGITGRVSDLRRRFGVDLVVELKKKVSRSIGQRVKLN